MNSKPDYAARLTKVYGEPSQSAFGSAVFHEILSDMSGLAQAAKEKYRYFVGKLWDQYGEVAWMTPWKEVYIRDIITQRQIVSELRNIADSDARISVPMILDNIDDSATAQAALSGAFDDPAVTELRVFNIGDGAAMSGILIAALRGKSGEATFLVFLMD